MRVSGSADASPVTRAKWPTRPNGQPAGARQFTATVAADRPGSRPSESGRSRCAAISSGWCGASSGHAATISSQRTR